jgi:fibronectin type 3 domain-containing protein
LTSSGTATLTVNSISVSGSGFSLTPIALPLNLNPGQSASITLTFDPTTTGSMTGQLAISSNSSTNPSLAIPLSGTATSPTSYQVNLTWQAPTSTTDPVSGYHVYRAASGTTSYALLNSALNTPTTYTDSSVQSGSSYDYMVKSVDASGMESSPSNTTTVNVP